eukprot:6954266-Pyramimonas_sp.AAC.1
MPCVRAGFRASWRGSPTSPTTTLATRGSVPSAPPPPSPGCRRQLCSCFDAPAAQLDVAA